MKKVFSYAVLFMLAGIVSVGFTSCGSSDDDEPSSNELRTEQQTAIQNLTNTYLEAVVYPTYTNLANQSQQLYDLISAFNTKLQGGQTVTNAEVQAICDKYLEARKSYEESEAFLYGAASDFNIDPHIDTWPLDLPTLKEVLQNTTAMNQFKTLSDNAAIAFARTTFPNDGQLGFHGIEFIFFRDGAARSASVFNNDEVEVYSGGVDNTAYFTASDNVKAKDEVVYAKVVAGDLRDKTFQLEVAWEGSRAAASHVARVNECVAEGSFGSDNGTVSGTGLPFGQDLAAAGTAQSSLASSSVRAALEVILHSGCNSICDEVAQQKMGQAYRSANGQAETDDDPNYIESPYSYNSFTDFYDNIMSIQNSLYGNMDAATGSYAANSIMAFLVRYYPDYATELQTSLTNAQTALQACRNSGTPFVKNPGATYVNTAMTAVAALADELDVVKNYVVANLK